MKIYKICILTVTVFIVGCTEPREKLIQEWGLSDISTLSLYNWTLNFMSNDHLLKKSGSIKADILDGYSKKEKENLYKYLQRGAIKRLERYSDNLYLSFYSDNTFNALIVPHYIEGQWEFSPNQDSLKLEYFDGDKKKNISAYYEFHGDQMVLILNKLKQTDLWGLDTLLFTKNENKGDYRNIVHNKWRFSQGDIVQNMSNHIDYLISLYNDALTNDKKSIDLEYSILCTPFRFYSNGIGIHELNSTAMYHWKKTFNSENDFNTAYTLLVQAFKSCRIDGTQGNKFKRNIDFLKQVKEKLSNTNLKE